jgi:hypothetical protein
MLSGTEVVGLLVGLGLGLLGVGPLIWLAAEAHRVGHMELTRAGYFPPAQLALVWLLSALLGGYLAARLTRWLGTLGAAQPRNWPAHLARLALACGLTALAAPLLPALILALLRGEPGQFGMCYRVAGGFVGWQSGVIVAVFLYTFRVLHQIRIAREVCP